MSEPIVFDQYQRYHLIERVVRLIGTNGCRVLEIGAKASPLPTLLPEFSLTSVDSDSRAPGVQIRATGLRLPFRDRAFEMVVSTDVIEHMDLSNRASFVQELCRVSSSTIILGFPHSSPMNREADQAFFEFIKKYAGFDFEYLNEHLKYGLPDAETIQKEIESVFAEVLTIKNANSGSWLFMQLANFILTQQPDLEPMRILLNDFFNHHLEEFSHGAPQYRTFLIASRTPFSVDIRTRIQAFNEVRNTGDLTNQYGAQSLALISAAENAIHAKNAEIKNLQSEAVRLRKTVADSERKIRHYARSNEALKNYLNLFLNHPVYKVYKLLKQFAQKMVGKIWMNPIGDIPYLIFQNKCEPDENVLKKQSTEWQNWASKPVLNIVTAVFDPLLEHLQEAMDSVSSQTYGNWVWNVADASTDDGCWEAIQAFAQKDSRVKARRLPGNEGISANLNVVLKEATGDYIVFLDHDDVLAPHALYAVAKAIQENPEIDFIYSDADKLDESGRRCEPLFKPDWSPEMMLCCNLMNQISVFRRSLLEKVGFLDPLMDGAQDWDLYLRIMEETDRIHHIPQILYHWRKTPQSCAQTPENKPYAKNAQISSVRNHLIRSGRKDPEITFDESNPVHTIHPVSSWQISSQPEISVIVPTADHVEVLARCVEGLFSGTAYTRFRLILVDTGSSNANTFKFYKKFGGDPRFQLVLNDPPFNFGKACNLGAKHANGSLLLFLNNDIEILHPDWLNQMAQWFEIPEIGVVGPKLLYPTGKIQHAGIIIGLGGLAGHLFLGSREHCNSIFGSDEWYRNVSAVTGACMLVRKQAFDRAGGFDENYQLGFSDVDLCLRIKQIGYRIAYTPLARLIHHESLTHGRKLPRTDFEYANKKLAKWLAQGDPYFNPNVSYRNPLPHFRNNPEDSCLDTNRVLMNHLPKTPLISLPVKLPQKKRARHFTQA